MRNGSLCLVGVGGGFEEAKSLLWARLKAVVKKQTLS